MENFNTMVENIQANELFKLGTIVREKGIWFMKMELEYRKKSKMLLVRFIGARNMILSENYIQMVENQLKELQESFIVPLIENIGANFILSLSVNPRGRFSLSDTTLKFKIDCGRGIHMKDSFREPFAILQPFALYITNLDFRGHRHRVVVVEACVKLTPEDLHEILEKPFIAPRTREQWYHIATHVYEEAKLDYSYEVSIPCVEGEMYWENKIDTIQFTLYEKKSRVQVL